MPVLEGAYLLRFIVGSHRGRELTLLPDGQISFGASADVDVVLDGAKIAPLQAVVRNESSGVSITLVASDFATMWVQGHPVTGRQRLFHGAVIHIGLHEFKVLREMPPGPGAPAPLDVGWLRTALDFIDDRTVAEPTSTAMLNAVTGLHFFLKNVAMNGCRVTSTSMHPLGALLSAVPRSEAIPEASGPGYAVAVIEAAERLHGEWEDYAAGRT